MNFGTALELVKAGHSVRREGWNGKGQWIALYTPTEIELMDLPFLYIRTVQGTDVPWLASQTDILADDWQIVR